MRPDADTTLFNFTTQSGDFRVYAFSGMEQVSYPYEFSVDLVNLSANVDVAGLLGSPASLTILDRSGSGRQVHGLIREMEQLHSANRFTHYSAILVPRLWFLGQITDHRIFQNMSVVEIIQKILKEQGFGGNESSFKLSYKYKPREYCVQYGETYLHFISRLCEEEGIYFYFEHAADSHCLCFCDREGGPPISGESDLRYFQGSGQTADTAVISRLRLHQQVNSNAAAYRDWNFTQPKLDLHVEDRMDAKEAPVPQGMNLEQYRYPYLYQLRAEGTRYVRLQTSRQLTFSRWIEIESDVSRYLPSYTFSIHHHDSSDINATWWVYSVHHHGEQPGVLEHEAPSGRGLYYQTSVTAIPEMTRYIPELTHAKNRIIGDQTAIVTGPEGEEIYPDEYGRVKVQFFWDREGQWNEKTTCWVMVSQGWAGGQYGSMAIPRIGHEVIVSFLEGDPDRPIITGRVYHELNRVPYTLPDNKTLSVIFKSFTSPENGGFNELRIEDKRGMEEIYLRGEKDVNVYVKNDWSDMICADTHRHTGKNDYVRTDGETHHTLKKDRMFQLEANEHLTINGSRYSTIVGTDQLKTGALHVVAGSDIVLEAGSRIVLKVGGTFITLNGEGITEQGPMIWENCGKSVPVSPVHLVRAQPDAPKGADKGTSPNGGEMVRPMLSKEKVAAAGQSDSATMKQTSTAQSLPSVQQSLTIRRNTVAVFNDIPAEQKLRLQNKFVQAMRESYVKNAHGDVIGMREQGGWIIRNPDGTYDLQRLPAGPISNDPYALFFRFPRRPPANAIGTFHTHPAPLLDAIGPSNDDIDIARDLGLPGIVMGPNPVTSRMDMKAYDLTTKKY